MNDVTQARPLVQVDDLQVHFPIREGLLRRQVGAVRAVDGVSFDIHPGETLGLVGESGCGKSTTGLAVLRLLALSGGSVQVEGVDLAGLNEREMRAMRRRMQMVFQDPHASLNPRMTVGSIVGEPLDVHAIGSRAERRERTEDLLALVGLAPSFINRYPHEFSGGQRQRIGLARALALNPSLIIADEPIAALDVSIQAQVVNLMADLRARLGLSYLMVSHDLSMVRYLSDRVAVMYLGRIVEIGGRDAVFDMPRHPYTRALLSAVPVPDPKRERARQRITLQGDVPSPAKPPAGCHFHPRCPMASARCRDESPQLNGPTGATPSPALHRVACHHA
ncbi:ABC transporter ATP-binding protein [Leptothrix discophora]|uniref:ABC transporter ATP-binding protein n=1 Tax=Leptothrix discophora TaxID=89 RepID=A0ABT9G2W3_LEPDI|nr:ABC transporter ATP-binding protein [Leptothrix discophora]MDP4300820.1 ABC transporter ATP-binding protein [Leptothrix discophora]